MVPQHFGEVLDGDGGVVGDVVEGILHLDQTTAYHTGEVVELIFWFDSM